MNRMFLLITIILLMVMAGWITFEKSGRSASVTLHPDEVQKDSQAVLEQGKKLVDSIENKSSSGSPVDDSSDPVNGKDAPER